MITITRFGDLWQRVFILNELLGPVKHQIGSEVRDILHRQLWAIVSELNSTLNLGLDNTALELTVAGDRLRIHYWSDAGGEAEVNIFIDRTFAVDKRTTGINAPTA